MKLPARDPFYLAFTRGRNGAHDKQEAALYGGCRGMTGIRPPGRVAVGRIARAPRHAVASGEFSADRVLINKTRNRNTGERRVVPVQITGSVYGAFTWS